ncbi:hypothetical protein ZWY2020_011039 [Hordeum vulgare]|nr:hypothetical protein ZWY2020_011039 [Hordeum vulgare]
MSNLRSEVLVVLHTRLMTTLATIAIGALAVTFWTQADVESSAAAVGMCLHMGVCADATSEHVVEIVQCLRKFTVVEQAPKSSNAENGGNNQDLVNGCNGSPPTLPPTEVSGLDDSTFKVVRLLAEQRKEKIHRHLTNSILMTRDKMHYACRKTLADSRPRVRGRFAKNEELCEATRSSSQNYDEYGQIRKLGSGGEGPNLPHLGREGEAVVEMQHVVVGGVVEVAQRGGGELCT